MFSTSKPNDDTHSERQILLEAGSDSFLSRQTANVNEATSKIRGGSKRTDTIWEKFRHEFADERLDKMRLAFPLSPPQFYVPTPMEYTWDYLYSGPEKWRLGQVRLRGATAQGAREKKASADPDRFEEDMEQNKCEEMMINREKAPTFARTYGCQLFLFCVVVIVCGYFYAENEGGRRSSLEYKVFIAAYIWFVMIFSCTWSKAVYKIGDVLFMWLAQTYGNVMHSGDYIAILVRRQLFMRVLGFIHCDEKNHNRLYTRLNWDKLGSHLSVRHSVFNENDIAEDLTVDAHSWFLDADGCHQRFKWKIELNKRQDGNKEGKDERNGAKCYIYQSGQHKTGNPDIDIQKFGASKKFEPWTHTYRGVGTDPVPGKGIQWIRDMQSDDVSNMVKQHPWWEKFEFMLRAEQHKIIGFRVYLGSRFFDTNVRFKFWVTIIPVGWSVITMIRHILYVQSDPFIFCDVWQLMPHFIFCFAFGVVINLLALCGLYAKVAAKIVTICMQVLMFQIRKEWAYIIDASDIGRHLAQDPNDVYKQWAAGNTKLLDDIDNISHLWQVITCDESIKKIAHLASETWLTDSGTQQWADVQMETHVMQPLRSVFN